MRPVAYRDGVFVVCVAVLLTLPGLVVVGFMDTGGWSTTGVTAGTPSGAPAKEGGLSGPAPAQPVGSADVKGSMPVQQVVDAFPSDSAAQLRDQLGTILDTPPSTQLKTLVDKGNGVDLRSLRAWMGAQAAW